MSAKQNPVELDESEFLKELDAESDEVEEKPQRAKRGSSGRVPAKAKRAVTIIFRWVCYTFTAIVPALGFTDEEIKGMQDPATRLIVRRVPLVKYLGDDAIDILEIMGVLTLYTKRIAVDRTPKIANEKPAHRPPQPLRFDREGKPKVQPTDLQNWPEPPGGNAPGLGVTESPAADAKQHPFPTTNGQPRVDLTEPPPPPWTADMIDLETPGLR